MTTPPARPSQSKPRPRPKARPPAKPQLKPKAKAGGKPKPQPRRQPKIEVETRFPVWERWRNRVVGAWRLLKALPSSLRTILALDVVGVCVIAANVIYWVAHKPAELLLPVSVSLVKTPAQTWASYGELFRDYATASVPAELLAALAQVESSGNPAAHTYWRWNAQPSDLFQIYRPASSSVGMYQMTNPAYADAQHYCIRHHVVVKADPDDERQVCGSSEPIYFRVVPAHAIELTAIFLDRAVTAALGPRLSATATQQRQDLAAVIHLCGAGSAKGFINRHFRPMSGERCGDHDPAAYLAQVNAMARQFKRLAEQ